MAFVDLNKLHPSKVREAVVTLFFIASLFTQAEEVDVLDVSERLVGLRYTDPGLERRLGKKTPAGGTAMKSSLNRYTRGLL